MGGCVEVLLGGVVDKSQEVASSAGIPVRDVGRGVGVVEVYLYIYPYAGDDVSIHPERIEVSDWRELPRIHGEAWSGSRGLSLLDVLEDLEGRRVRVVIEQRRLTVEVLE